MQYYQGNHERKGGLRPVQGSVRACNGAGEKHQPLGMRRCGASL